MGWLEDLILGSDAILPDYSIYDEYSGMTPEERRRKRDQEMLGYRDELRSMWSGATASPEELFQSASREAGLTDVPPPQAEAVGESVDAIEKLKEAAAGAQQAEEDERAALQRETNLSSLRSLEQMPADKLRQIRAEARAKGRAGSLGANVYPTEADYDAGGGGTFSQQADTPELQQRLRGRDEWANLQPQRNMEFLTTPEQAQRNPELAVTAGEVLAQMRQQQNIAGRQRVQEQFVSKLAGGEGTIPPEQAAQLQALGVSVPYNAIGSSADEGMAFFDDAISKAGAFLSKLDPTDAVSGHPMIKIQKFGVMRAEHFRRLVENGQMSADDARNEWTREMAGVAMAEGLINEQEMASMMQQPGG